MVDLLPMPPEDGRLKEDAQSHTSRAIITARRPGGHCHQTGRAAKPHQYCRRRNPAAPRNATPPQPATATTPTRAPQPPRRHP